MAKQYQWRRHFNLISGGYPGEGVGVVPNDQSWQTTDALSGSVTADYYYHDSPNSSDANSTKVVVTLRDDWTASINNRNQLTINLTSTITEIKRVDQTGVTSPDLNRSIYVRRYKGGPVLWQIVDVPTYNHVIATNINLGTYTFTLEPGMDATRDSLYYRNNTAGHDNDTPPSQYIDEIAMGIQFKNILPADYRPGKIWDGSTWQSHNRAAGFEKINTSESTTREMRTIDGGVGTGNPPLIYNERWLNERLIGNE